VSRKLRRAKATRAKQRAKKGAVAGVETMGVNPMTEAQQQIANEHGRTSPLLYRALLWTLRGAWEEAVAAGMSADKQKVRLYSVGGPDAELSWRYAEFNHAQDMLTAKSLARKAGAVGFVWGRYTAAPDEVWGYGLTLEHEAFRGILEMHHWSHTFGWRIYDGTITKIDDKVELVWTPQPEEAP
jgi:hypothetical protein